MVGLDPEAHGVLASAENLHGADAVETRDLVTEINVGEVGEELGVVGAIRGIKSDEHERRSYGFLDGDAVVGDVAGKLRCGLRGTQLRENEIGVRVGLYVVIDDQAHATVGGRVQRIHVVHVVHAAHLLLDGRGNGLFDGASVGADVRSKHLNFGWYDVREESDRESENGDGANNDHDDGDHHGNNGAIDEKF